MDSLLKASDRLAFLPSVVAGLRLLSRREVRRAAWLAVAMVAGSLLDILAVAALLPFVNLVVEPTAVRSNDFLRRLYTWLGAADVPHFILLVGVGVIVLMVLSAVVNWCLLYFQNRFAASCQTRLAKTVLDRCLQAPYAWFLSRNSITLSHLVYDDVVLWSRGFVQRLLMMVNHLLVIGMALALVLTFSLRTGLLVIAAVALLGYAAVYFTRPLLTRLAETKRAALNAVVLTANQALAGIKDIKLSSREGHFSDLFRSAYSTVTGAHAGLNVWQETPSLTLQVLAQVTLVALALVFLRMGIESGQIATQVALLIIVTTKVVPTVSRLSVAVSALFNALPHVRAIREVMESIEREAARVPREPGTGKAITDWSLITFDRVGYRYPDSADWALKDLTVALARSGSYGIVGPSAAGKSTLVDLLIALLEPTEGRICVDGEALQALELKSWQRRIGYVPQMPFIADTSLRANVAFGVPREKVDDAWVLECLRLANLSDLPGELERGVDTPLGERGSRLSGGQRQRIAIARALFNRPEILVLDEATSALDTVTEGEILGTLKNLRGQVTLVTIAHRLSTVAPCDEIFVLEDGRLVGQGNYAELKGNHELFRRMATTRA